MKRHVLAVFILGLLLATRAMPVIADSVNGSKANLPDLGSASAAQVLRGTFVQKKHLSELDRPLVSSGTYVVAQGHGLLWQIQKPVTSQLVITPQKLIERSNGQQTNHISAQQQPALRAVASVLLALFKGNTEQLSRYFKSQRASDGNTLTLTPKTEALSHYIKGLAISDSGHTRRIRINRPNGDYSVIKLKATDDNHPLSPQERHAFGS